MAKHTAVPKPANERARDARIATRRGAHNPSRKPFVRARRLELESVTRSERWPSGRRHSPAKGAYGPKPVSRVRIPLSPPDVPFTAAKSRCCDASPDPPHIPSRNRRPTRLRPDWVSAERTPDDDGRAVDCLPQEAAEVQRYCDEQNAEPAGWCRIYYRIRVVPDTNPPAPPHIVAPDSDPTSRRVLDDGPDQPRLVPFRSTWQIFRRVSGRGRIDTSTGSKQSGNLDDFCSSSRSAPLRFRRGR